VPWQPQDFGRSVIYLHQEEQIIPTTLLLAPPDFQTFLRPWYYKKSRQKKSRAELCPKRRLILASSMVSKSSYICIADVVLFLSGR
jgi:hypothetical protein